MNKEEFIKFIENNIIYHLPDNLNHLQIKAENMELMISEEDSSKALRIHLDDVYNVFVQDKQMFPVMEVIAANIVEAWAYSEKMDNAKEQIRAYIDDYDEAKKYLQIIICDPDVRNVPEDCVVTKVDDYVAQYKIILNDIDEENVPIRVTETLLNRWGITKEQLHQDALAVQEKWNKPVLMEVLGLSDHLRFNTPMPKNLLDMDGEEISEDDLYVLTNEEMLNGAGIITHSEVLEKIGELLAGKNYYVLPSSIHEWIIFPDTNRLPVEDIRKVVHDINRTEVTAQDLLSDKVLYYDSKDRKLELAVEKEEILSENISFYAAECMEFPSLGVIYENLTLEEAIEKYESIPAERMNGIKGIGFDLQDGSDYEGKYDLMHLGKVDRENVEMIEHYKNNPEIQKALDTLEKYCETKSLAADEVTHSKNQSNTTGKKKENQIQTGLHR